MLILPYSEKLEVFRYNAIASCGVMLTLLALQNFLDRIIPARYLDKVEFVKKIFSSGTVRMERNMKMAASFKINRLIRNAHAVHQSAEYERGTSDGKDSSYGTALLCYAKTSDQTEEVGGFW